MLKEIDCFVTKEPVTSTDPEAGNADEYVGAVWSVALHRPIAAVADTGSSSRHNVGIPCKAVDNQSNYTRFKIDDDDGKLLFTNGYITAGYEVEINIESTHFLRDGSTTQSPNAKVLEPGNRFYMTDITSGSNNELFFGLAWRPFETLTDDNRVYFSTLNFAPVEFGNSTTSYTDGSIKFTFREKDPVAYVVNHSTAWIMSAYSDASVTLEVGDRVRIGSTTEGGFTDYARVLQKVPVKQLGCGIYEPHIEDNTWSNEFHLKWAGVELPQHPPPDNLLFEPLGDVARGADLTKLMDASLTVRSRPELVSLPTATYAYRVSTNINCTMPPDTLVTRTRTVDHSNTAQRIQTQLEARNCLIFDEQWASVNPTNTARTPGERKRFFPLFRMRNSVPKPLTVSLGHTIKSVYAVKLCGYSVVNAAADHDYQHGHELEPSDWIAIDLKDIQGEVMSNNPHANGAFAVLHAGHVQNSSLSGAVEYHTHDPQGIVSVQFERPTSAMRQLEVSFRNAKGAIPNAARIHLWFKLVVSQG